MGSNVSLVDLPSGKVTEKFIIAARDEFEGVRLRKWNSERVICFFAAILRKEPGKQKYGEVRKLLAMRLQLWEQGKFATLCRACAERGRVTTIIRRPIDKERRARKFNALVLAGKVRSAVRQATDRSEGGLMDPFDLDVKSGLPVHEALAAKHPDLMVPDLSDEEVHCFEEYENGPPGLLPLSVCDDVMLKIAKRLRGGAGPGGVDSHLLRDILFRFERASCLFRDEMAAWVDYLANSSPPIGAYRAFMNNRLLAGKKRTPGIRPIACGEIFRRYWGKVVMEVTGFQAMEACGSQQLCAALPVGCEAAIHAAQRCLPTDGWEDVEESADAPADGGVEEDGQAEGLATQETSNEEEDVMEGDSDDDRVGTAADNDNFDPQNLPLTGLGMMLVDAENGFNNASRFAMLWTIRHRWSRAARFSFNCYRHQAKCFVRKAGGEAIVILSKEGASQGCPLAGTMYGVGTLPLCEKIHEEMRLEEDMCMPFYADDFGSVATAQQNARLMLCLELWGPGFGYSPTAPKSLYVCDAREQAAAREIFDHYGVDIKFAQGGQYLGGFVGTEKEMAAWLEPKVEEWCMAVKTMEDIARRYPQTAYYGVAASLQNEWQHICRTVQGAGAYLEPLEDALASFLSTLLDAPLDDDGKLRTLLGHKVKQAGMGIPKPTVSAESVFETSLSACSELIRSLRHRIDIDTDAHKQQVGAARNAARAERESIERSECNRQIEGADRLEENRMKRAKSSGSWLSTVPTHRNGTTLSAEEFTDNIRYRNGFEPTNLPQFCDGCGAQFSTEHGLNCKHGGLVNERHDATADEWIYLAGMAFQPSACSHKPMVNEGNPRGRGNGGAGAPAVAPVFRRGRGARGNNPYVAANTTANTGTAEVAAAPVVETDLEGDKGIRGFWKHGRECIFDIRITNTESRSHRNKDPVKCLAAQEKEKKGKYETACHEQRKDFTPLVYSIDGMAGPATRAAERRMASRLAWKWKREYSEMVGYVRTRMSLAVVRSNTLMWRGSRTRRRAHPGFIENGGAMHLWQTFGEQ